MPHATAGPAVAIKSDVGAPAKRARQRLVRFLDGIVHSHTQLTRITSPLAVTCLHPPLDGVEPAVLAPLLGLTVAGGAEAGFFAAAGG